MKITFSFNGQLASAAETHSATIECEKGKLLKDCVIELSKRFNDSFSDLLLDNGNIANSIIVAINNEQIVDKNESILNYDCEVMLMTPLAGG